MLIKQLLDDFEMGHNPKPVYSYCASSSAEPERTDPKIMLLDIVK